jgi:hypothetical protein
MAIPTKPTLDAWYRDDEGRSFKIVAIDEDDGNIDIQFFDGDIAEVDSESWYQLDISRIAEPEDGSGPFDGLDADDLETNYGAHQPLDWNGPADEMDYE